MYRYFKIVLNTYLVSKVKLMEVRRQFAGVDSPLPRLNYGDQTQMLVTSCPLSKPSIPNFLPLKDAQYCVTMYLYMDSWVAFTSRLLRIMLWWTWENCYCQHTKCSLNKHSEVRMLHLTLILFIICEGSFILFP